jgi:SecD/SecF fusion protein
LDFVSKGRLTLAVSGLLITIGVGSLFLRGSDIFDIDFAGGSSVQFRVSEGTETEKIRGVIRAYMDQEGQETIPFTVNGVSVNGVPEDTVYKIDTAQEQVNELKQLVADAFKGNEIELVTYSIKVTSADLGQSSWRPLRDRSFGNGVMLTSAPLQDESAGSPQESGDQKPAEPAAPSSAAESTDGDVTDPAPAATSDPAPAATVPSAEVLPKDSSEEGVETAAVITLGIGKFDDSGDAESPAKANRTTLEEKVIAAAANAGISLTDANIALTPRGDGTEAWEADSQLPFDKWEVVLNLPPVEAGKVMEMLKADMSKEPVWISSSSVGSRVAEDMIGRAFGALFASLLCIIAYIWFRFQRVIYGFAAVAALLHDVLITLGAIAVSAYVAGALGFLQIDEFKISLTVVAAILTIIGYSLNDTIVVFDRIRETKGKAPRLTGEMINTSINQTLSRTLLTSLTTLIVVMLLYWFGGEGIHAFAFALVVGVIAGTYSSIFIASPILLYLIERGDKRKAA